MRLVNVHGPVDCEHTPTPCEDTGLPFRQKAPIYQIRTAEKQSNMQIIKRKIFD